jgi:tryptophanyl-tRNA synthetase
MKKDAPTIVSGIQPTGMIHIGNWAGTLRNWPILQDQHPGRCLFFIADYHAMTIDYDPAERREQVIDLAATLLALGIGVDPKKSTLFLQSDVPEVTELCWIFNTVTPVAEMERMTQYKDKAGRDLKNINMGLLDYPVLMAVDIVLYGGDAVPVGGDQIQHVETTRVIARNFNRRFGETFPEPQPLLTETPKVMSLADPTKKMSKSHGPNSVLALDDEPDVILDKMKRVPTEPSGLVDDKRLATEEYAGVALLFDLLKLCGADDVAADLMKSQPIKYGEMKKRVAEAVAARFAGYRAKKKALLADRGAIAQILAAGGEKARALAQAKMAEVREKTGLR